MATDGSLIIQRGNRLFAGMELPELAEEVVPSLPQSKAQNNDRRW